METTVTRCTQADLIVVGGGLAGLCAAALVARAGRTVIVLEKAGHLGGRAGHPSASMGFIGTSVRTRLYRHGHAFRLLTELGVPSRGGFRARGGACSLRVRYRINCRLGSVRSSARSS